jgi:hypothetical protein
VSQYSPDWLPRLTVVGATTQETSSIAAAYQSAAQPIQHSLNEYIKTLDDAGVLEVLTVWRQNPGGPFGYGAGGGGLPFGTEAAILTNNTADDAFAISAGTGEKLTTVLGSGTPISGQVPVYTGTGQQTAPGAGGSGGGRTVSSLSYGATITPALPASGDLVVNIAMLTGNPAIANPTGTPSDGQLMKLRFTEDSTGNRVPTWGTRYDFNGQVTAALIAQFAATPSSRFTIVFEYYAALSGSTPWVAQAINAGY